MSTLATDISRCAGRTLPPRMEDASVCPRREHCYRYMALAKFDRPAGIVSYADIDVYSHECKTAAFEAFEPIPDGRTKTIEELRETDNKLGDRVVGS